MNNSLLFGRAKFTSGDFVMLDTSFIASYLGCDKSDNEQNELRSNECKNLVNSIARANAYAVIAQGSIRELTNIVISSTFNRNSGAVGEAAIKRLKESCCSEYQENISEAVDRAATYIKRLMENPVVYPELLNANGMDESVVHKIMSDYRLHGYADAEFLAIAIEHGIQYFATTDSDFNNVNDSNVQILVDSGTYYNK